MNQRYVSIEEEQFLEAKKSAYERVLEQAAKFMKKEAFLWKQNRELYERAVKVEKELLEVKEFLETFKRDKS